jgi:hypothetical protein
MEALQDHARRFIERALSAVSQEEAADVYVVSLFVYDEEDDPYRPTATVGFNTESEVAASAGSASDEAEARWNFAFWLQNDLGIMCDPRTDPDGAALRDQWVRSSGLTADDEQVTSDVTRQFVAMLERVVYSLHDDGVVERVFGRPIPVLIHELEYYEDIAMQNQRANPNGLADAFAEWVGGASDWG